MIVVFIWYLLTMPTDRLVCTLWTNEPPGPAALRQACGYADLAAYRLDVIPLGSSKVVCSQPGADLIYLREKCTLNTSLDQFTVRVIQPAVTEVICSISIDHDGNPDPAEITEQCGAEAAARYNGGRAQLRFVIRQERPTDPPKVCAVPRLGIGPGLYDQAPNVAALWSEDQLTWLAGRLIWFGLVIPDCDGASGLDPDTLAATPCGMTAARGRLVDWQNQFDGDIYNAAVAFQVPAQLLKRMIAMESQYWPLSSGSAGETGMLQVSENGADVLLRYDPGLDPEYPRRPKVDQYWKRREVINMLACAYCSLTGAVSHVHEVIQVYARILAAYRCRAVEMDPDLSGAAAWRQAAIDYNGSTDYLRRLEQ